MSKRIDVVGVRFLDRFVKQVADHGDQLAARSGTTSITYAELDDWSEAVARRLQPADREFPAPIVVMSGHDVRAVAGFVGTVKAGRPAVFLDTSTPIERMRQILQLAAPVATLVTSDYADVAAELSDVTGAAIPLEDAPVPRPSDEAVSPDPGRTLTIVFTSGSTGVPKGVIIGDAELCEEMGNAVFGDVVARRVGCPQPLSFIAGTSVLTRALMIGASVYLYDPRRRGITGMVDWILDNKITDLNVTPHIMRSVARAAVERGVVFDSIEMVLCGGEAMMVPDVEIMRRCTSPACIITNASGSSEGWGVSYLAIDRDYQLPPYGQVPAGRAFDDRELFLLDEGGQRITEPNVTGMIMISARNMALGYLNNQALTAERFSVDDQGRRVYRTGDLGRWNDAGELEYAGRSDHMLKIRGYLVEPAEVETRLMAERELLECVVIGRPSQQDGLTQLVAYVVPDPSRWVSTAALRRRLATELPTYMVPPVIKEMQSLPRNPNGKIDRQALEEVRYEPDDDLAAGWNSLESVIGGICCGALGMERIGRNDDLFALGADSLAVEEILAALDSDVGIKLTSSDLIQHPTIHALASLQRAQRAELVGDVAVPLSTGGEGTPLFLIAGAGALALQFRELARSLGGNRPIFGLQARGLEGAGHPDFTLRAMIGRYLRAIRQLQPHGPYNIAGHSMGALLAVEVASRLASSGEVVRMLGLLDPIPTDAEHLPPQLVERLGQGHQPKSRAHRRHFSLTYLRGHLGETRPYLTRGFWRDLRSDRYRAYFNLGGSLLRKHKPPARPLRDVSATVFVAADQVGAGGVPDLSAYLGTAPAVEMVGGDHLSMLRAPYVANLAVLVEKTL